MKLLLYSTPQLKKMQNEIPWMGQTHYRHYIYFNYCIRVNSSETMRDTYVAPEHLEINSNKLLAGGRNTIHYI